MGLLKSKVFLFALALVIALGAAFLTRPATRSVEAGFDGEPKIVAATFAAIWCGSCRILKPRLADVIPEFRGRPVVFVEYDLSFGEEEAARAKARAQGLETVFDGYARATGFTLLIDAQSKEVLDILTASHSRQAMRTAIEAALAEASAP